MIRRNSKIGNASAIFKACFAFAGIDMVTKCTVYAFEGRLNDEMTANEAYMYGRKVAPFASCLPLGKLTLPEYYYAAGSEKTFKGETYESIGAFIDSFDYDNESVKCFRDYLEIAAKYLSKAYSDEGITEMPNEEELCHLFIKGEDFVELKDRMAIAFSEATRRGIFNKLLYNAMANAHQECMVIRCDAFQYVSGKLGVPEISEMMPFGVLSGADIVKIYTIFLPIILTSGIVFDRESFLKYRLERGRELLRGLVKGEVSEEDIEGAVVKAFYADYKKLVPYIPEELFDEIEKSELGVLTALVIYDVWRAMPVMIPTSCEETDALVNEIMHIFEDLSSKA